MERQGKIAANFKKHLHRILLFGLNGNMLVTDLLCTETIKVHPLVISYCSSF